MQIAGSLLADTGWAATSILEKLVELGFVGSVGEAAEKVENGAITQDGVRIDVEGVYGLILSGNWSFEEPPFREGDVIEGCNCSQLLLDTEICATIKDLTINGGNFVNCKPQPTWTLNGGNWCQKSFCSHEHPEWMEKGLPDCTATPESIAYCNKNHRDGDVKQWVMCGEDEYREIKHSIDAKKPPLRESSTKDADDVITQKFEKQVYVYNDSLVRTG